MLEVGRTQTISQVIQALTSHPLSDHTRLLQEAHLEKVTSTGN